VVVDGEGETTMADCLPALATHGRTGCLEWRRAFRDEDGTVRDDAERIKIADLDTSLPDGPDR